MALDENKVAGIAYLNKFREKSGYKFTFENTVYVHEEYLNKGIVKKPKYTNIDSFIESAKKFFPKIEDSEYIGSMYTIRTVLPYKDETDERPTIVTKRDNNFILFSSKIGNCVDSSEEILNIIKNEVIEN